MTVRELLLIIEEVFNTGRACYDVDVEVPPSSVNAEYTGVWCIDDVEINDTLKKINIKIKE